MPNYYTVKLLRAGELATDTRIKLEASFAAAPETAAGGPEQLIALCAQARVERETSGSGPVLARLKQLAQEAEASCWSAQPNEPPHAHFSVSFWSVTDL